MKLVEFNKASEPLWGYYLDIIKLRSKSIITLSVDESAFKRSWPSLLIQFGGPEFLHISAHIFGIVAGLSIYSRHYDD